MVGQVRRKTPLFCGLLCAVAIFVASSSCSTVGAIVKVGMIAPFNGRDASVGYNALFGAKLAVRQWNDRRPGLRVEMVAQDESGGAESGALQARKMAVDGDVLGVVGHLDAASAMAAAPIYASSGMALLTLASLPPPVPSTGVFRLVADEAEVVAAARRFATAEGVAALSVWHGASLQADRLAARSAVDAPAQGLPVVGPWAMAGPGAPALAATPPDEPPGALRLLWASGVEAGSLLAVRPSQSDSPVLVGPLASPDLFAVGGPAASGAYYLSLWRHPRDLAGAPAADFVRDYRALGQRDPWGVAAVTYDATRILLQAIGRAWEAGKLTRPEVVARLEQVGEFVGVTGPVAFAPGGERRAAEVYVYRVSGLSYPGELYRVLPKEGS